MKITIKNYLKSIHFKIMNDKMSQAEAVLFTIILIGATLLVMHVGDNLVQQHR